MAPPLIEALTETRERVSRYKGRGLNEQNTKATLIEPVLRALGWDLEDLEVVQREHKARPRANPVDYALFSGREPVLFVEAKALGQDLGDEKWASQVLGYATVAGAPWVLLTNGDEYRIYNAHAPVPVDKKLFRKVSVSASQEEAAETLALLERSRMAGSDLEALWKSHFVDQEVRSVIEELFGAGAPDGSLVSLVKRRAKGLTPRDVKASLARVRVELDFPPEARLALATPMPARGAKRQAAKAGKTGKAARKAPMRSEVTLADLIAAGVVRPPLRIFRTYKKQELAAQIEADAQVTFRGERFDALSAAAGAARKSVIGSPHGFKYPPTNGWTFWQFRDADGKARELATLREQFQRRSRLKVVG